MTFRLIFRGYVNGELLFREGPRDVHESELSGLAEKHSRQLMAHGEPYLLEIEFPDFPKDKRMFRFGTDPRGMVQPLAFNAGGGGVS